MKSPWANALLLAFIFAELVTGFFGLVSGPPDRAIFIQTHRVAGYGIILVLFWKTGNVRFSLRCGLGPLAPDDPPDAARVLELRDFD